MRVFTSNMSILLRAHTVEKDFSNWRKRYQISFVDIFSVTWGLFSELICKLSGASGIEVMHKLDLTKDELANNMAVIILITLSKIICFPLLLG